MPKIIAKDNEPFESTLRRFKRSVMQSGILQTLKDIEFYEKPTTTKKRKKSAAVKRQQQALKSQQLPKKLF